jgi:hypothetical protein
MTREQALKLDAMLKDPNASWDVQPVDATDAEVAAILKQLEIDHALEHKLLK